MLLKFLGHFVKFYNNQTISSPKFKLHSKEKFGVVLKIKITLNINK